MSACNSCAKKINLLNSYSYKKPVQVDCMYTLEQVKQLLDFVNDKELPYVKSQINVYANRCNALSTVINGLIEKYLS